ncbi:hypothetical protein TIFTF001_025520 [Ficus carica]|uniref:Uncharacterized protein n=1 Tax=Ficus carica TaxID=3494 RepID=A0AA88AJ34_FICCA|nr:hypothetical protein TIFTF001_025520 [Ficus carica]
MGFRWESGSSSRDGGSESGSGSRSGFEIGVRVEFRDRNWGLVSGYESGQVLELESMSGFELRVGVGVLGSRRESGFEIGVGVGLGIKVGVGVGVGFRGQVSIWRLGFEMMVKLGLRFRVEFGISLAASKLSVIFGARNMNATSLPKFIILLLGGCNITEFPDFLRHQNELLWLDLASNSIRGQIPKWIWNLSVETLQWMDFSNNFLTGFHHPPTILPWRNLIELYLNSNMLQGRLPIPPSSTEHFDVSNNMVSGEIFPLICNLSSVIILDLSNNKFSGTLPRCLGNSSRSLLALNLRNNSFHGIIWPLEFEKGSNLRMIDFGRNQFRGKLPRSLETCMMLEFLDFSSNHLVDIFPAWLGTLPGLKVLFLQKNGFHGAIRRHKNISVLPNLHIINLSYNSFTGELPSEYIFMWNGNKNYRISGLTYMNAWVNIANTSFFYYNYSTTMMTKSVETYYGEIEKTLQWLISLATNFVE